jgi:hypothetical protein
MHSKAILAGKIALLCILCVGVIGGIVYLVRWLA